MRAAGLPLLFAAGLLAACGPTYDGISLQSSSQYDGATLGPDLIEIPIGFVAVGEAAPRSKTGENFSATDLELQSEDPSILEVSRGHRLGRWAFVGVSVGETCVRVFVEDESRDCILAEVIPQ